MRQLFLTLICIISVIIGYSETSNTRQRNLIYVLDCTQSMQGFNGKPNIWEPIKNFLHKEIEKEAQISNNPKITILPFQDKNLPSIQVNPKDIKWNQIESILDGYIKSITYTNICDAWCNAEKCIDPSCENYLVLMTDGVDNIGGIANAEDRQKRLAEILTAFCGKYQNTKGLYVVLTEAADVSGEVLQAINICKDIILVDAKEGIGDFGCLMQNNIHVNTRDLPCEIPLGFSNTGTFSVELCNIENELINVSIKDDQIKKGKLILQVSSKYDDNVSLLNKKIGVNKTSQIPIKFESEDVSIINPNITLDLRVAELRTLNIDSIGANVPLTSHIQRTKPFLWIKGNDQDTLRWNLHDKFNDAAVKENSFVAFKLVAYSKLPKSEILYQSKPLAKDSIIYVSPNEESIIEMVIPASEKSGKVEFSLEEVAANNLDRINDASPEKYTVNFEGDYTTERSWLEWLCIILLGLIVLFLVIWFLFIKKAKYPTFKKGMVTINSPYYSTIKVKGARKIVLTKDSKKQGVINKIFTGKIIYHKNPSWTNEVELVPAGKNIRFRCASGVFVSDPLPTWTIGEAYKIKDVNTGETVINLNVN